MPLTAAGATTAGVSPCRATVTDAAVAEAGEALSRPGVAIEPRKLWPTALANLGLELKGKIANGPSQGRAIARLTDLGHGQALRALFRAGVADGPVPASLAAALLTVMKDWSGDWASSGAGRPVAIVGIESATRPQLVGDLATGLSRVMQIPIVGRFAIVDESVAPGQGAANSAQRVAAVKRRYQLAADVPPGPVLLVDDLVVSGWTLTVAGVALREAGATAVLPLVLGTQT